MPRIALCGRTVPLSADDFVFTAAWSLTVRVSWSACCAAVLATGLPACSATSSALPATAIALSMLGACVDTALIFASSRGSLAQVEARAAVPRLVEARAAFFVADVIFAGALLALVGTGCGAAEARLAALAASGITLGVACASAAFFAATWACASCCRRVGVQLATAEAALGKSKDAVAAQAVLNRAMPESVDAWAVAFRCLTLSLCPHAAHARDGVRADAASAHAQSGVGKHGRAGDLFDDVATMSGAVFEPFTVLGWTPSDVATAALLVTHNERAQRASAPVPQQSRGDKSLDIALARAAQLSTWVVAVNAAPIFCLSYGPLFSCVLLPLCGVALAVRDALSACVPARGAARCGISRAAVCVCAPTPCSGAPCLDCDRTATRAYLLGAGVRASLKWVGSPRARPWLTWFAAVNADTGEVIVSVRGTLSLENALFDVIGQPVALSELAGGAGTLAALVRLGGPALDATRTFVHEGFWVAAAGIAAEIRSRRLLDADRESARPPRLVLVGHSLGAAVATLLTLFFLADLPVETVAYAPPSAVMSPPLAAALEPFVTSVVLGDDIVPRLSARSIARTSHAMVAASLRARHSKSVIALRAAAGCAPLEAERLLPPFSSAPSYESAARAFVSAAVAAEAADASSLRASRARSSSQSSDGAREGAGADKGDVRIDVSPEAERAEGASAAWSALSRRMLLAGKVIYLRYDDASAAPCSALTRTLRSAAFLPACLCCSAAARPLRVTPVWATRQQFENTPVVPLSERALLDHLPHFYEETLKQVAARGVHCEL